MYKQMSLLISLLGMTAVSASVFAAKVDNKQHYKLDVNLPASWKVASNEKYSGGYVKVFVPKAAGARLNEQNVVMNYTRNANISLSASMHEVLKVVATADCSTRDVRLINQSKNSINFVASLDRCKNGKSLTQVFKIFNTPNGQYAILYTANPNIVSPGVISNMKKLV